MTASGDDRANGRVRSVHGVDAGPWVAFWTDQVDLIVRQDWQTLAARFADDFVFESFLAGLRVSLTGRRAYIQYLRDVAEGRMDSSVDVIEVRGDSLCLSRTRIFRPGDEDEDPWELTPRLILIRADKKDVLSLMEVYDVQDIDIARKRLDELAHADTRDSGSPPTR